LGQISDDYGFSKLQIVYYPKTNLSLLNAELYQLKLMVMISFIFFSGKLAVEQGVSYEYYFEVLTMMHEMVSKAQRRLCSLIVL
jgi:hypothetical protein